MLSITEWLPNPTGRDGTSNEWIELHNTDSAPATLRGFRIETVAGKKFVFKDEVVPPNGYLVISRASTKLTLKNQAGGLSLFDSSGNQVQTVKFLGQAPEGKSVNVKGDRVSFAKPTPGEPNAEPHFTALVSENVSIPSVIAPSWETRDFVIFAFVMGVAFAALMVFLIKRNNDLQELFFSRN